MLSAGPSAILHLVGFLTGALLFGMLLAMAMRPSARADRFAVWTGILGLAWNLGELMAYAAGGIGLATLAAWVHAASFTSLGLLVAVVVHSVAAADDHARLLRRRTGAAIAFVVYACAAVAGTLHVGTVVSGQVPPSSPGLTWLTAGLLGVIPVLVALTRHRPNKARALWMAALAVVAVSALHLGQFHVPENSWLVELGGHHSSIVLAFAILYQNYRFALADLFLKQALALLVLVALVFGGWSLVEPTVRSDDDLRRSLGVAALMLLWAGTALAYPMCRRRIRAFVDRVVLARVDYDALLSQLADDLLERDSADAVLDHGTRVLAQALTAAPVTWRTAVEPAGNPATGTVEVCTTEAPRYALDVGRLAGGRRLLSDDIAMLDRAALLIAHRIDALRLRDERYERALQEQEIRALATEAELRALRAQINPHFLFNALTTIGYLIQQHSPRALKTLLDLTTLLHSVLRSEGDFTTLGRELELVQRYLKIERERFGERLGFTLDVPSALEGIAVPALIVQPLVENAVKHGIAGARQGGAVTISARLGTDLRIIVRNTGSPLGNVPPPGSGVGLENVRRRLRHYFGTAARLTVLRDTDGTTRAELQLPTAGVEERQTGATARRAAR